MSNTTKPGVSGMSLYVPPLRVSLKDWCGWTGNSWDKIPAVVGRSFRVPGRHENVYTMAANAVLAADPPVRHRPDAASASSGLGTESSTDNAAGAVIVRGMVDRALESLGLPRLSRHLRGARVQACVPGRHVRAQERASLRRRVTARDRRRRSWSALTSRSTSAAAPASRRKAPARWRCWYEANPSCSRSTWRTPAARRTTAVPTSASRSRVTSPKGYAPNTQRTE